MCINSDNNIRKSKMINRKKLGRVVRATLTRANVERRLVCGLLPAIAYLEKSADDVVLCVLPQSRPGDATTHMQTVLLQAFCFENYIPVIQVNNPEKLAAYCGISARNKTLSPSCNCAIITKDISMTSSENEDKLNMSYSTSEQILADFYESTLEEYPRPIIELPI